VSKNYFQIAYKKKTKLERKLSNMLNLVSNSPRMSMPTNISFEKGDKLPEDYPVYYDYLYFADNSLISSDIQGTISNLIWDLHVQGRNVENIYRCIQKFNGD
jgi:type III secretory pathway lipoprotein EscJ